MPDRRYRVLAVATHPVQYMTPIFRRMAKHPLLDFQVAYCTLRGAEAGHDPEFGANIQWDVPLLDGYSWTHVPNRGSGAESFFGLFNPRMGKFIRSGKYDAVLCFVGYVRATFWMALIAAKLSKSAFLFGTDTTTLAPRDGRAWKAAFKKILWPRLFRLADQVIVPSSGSRDVMLSLGIPGDRVTLTPYSVDNDWWMQQASQVHRSAVRGACSPGNGPPICFAPSQRQIFRMRCCFLPGKARFVHSSNPKPPLSASLRASVFLGSSINRSFPRSMPRRMSWSCLRSMSRLP